MYLPAQFTQNDPRHLLALMRAHPFAVVVAEVDGASGIAHLPLSVDEADGRFTISGHVARGNPLWRADTATCVFSGPDAYISASWYGEAGMVPTWNHQAVHASGPLTAVEDPLALRAILERLGNDAEGPEAERWWQGLDEPAYRRLAATIVGVRIAVGRIHGIWKLHQHHPAERRRRTIAALRAGGTPNQQAIAAAMAETSP